MSKDKENIGSENPILTKKDDEPKFSAWNPFDDHGDGLDDEFYINEIIEIEELPYDEFMKDKEVKHGKK